MRWVSVEKALSALEGRRVMGYRYVHKNKCKGGIAVDEVNGKTYCYGRLDYETEEIDSQCKECPRLVNNCYEEIEEWHRKRLLPNEPPSSSMEQDLEFDEGERVMDLIDRQHCS